MIIDLILFYYFLAAVLYTLVFSLAGRFIQLRKIPSADFINKIAVLVPSYKEDSIILSVANHLSKIDYPTEQHEVFVIADSLKTDTIIKLKDLPVTVIEVSFEVSTKTKSLNATLSQIKNFDIAVILDADNIPQGDFLQKINDAFQAGHKVIQAQRVAKNLNTPYATLDAASEIINNHLFRKGANALGLSSSIIGSGMAYDFNLLKDELAKISAVGGFDKVLQLNVIECGHKILYLEGVLIFDEKIESIGAFKNQRRRWFSSQMVYWRKYFLKGFSMLLQGNVDYFNLSVVYNLFPPRIILLSSLVLIAVASTILYWPIHTFMSIKWWSLLVLYTISLAIALPKRLYNRQLLMAILKLPQTAVQIIFLMFKLKGANKKFIHTTHTKIEVDNNLYTNENR